MNKYMLLIVASVIISSFSQILLKKSAKKQYSSSIREYLNPYVIVGYSMMLLGTIAVVLAYHFGVEYKNGPVIESLGYILVLILSYFFFSEKITKKKIIGNALVLIGIVIFYM